jgi:anti-sigma factor RsiW
MIDPEREELLSAYLDGEVSPEERTRVEQWLAESSELRQMRDELLSIRTDLQALPRHQVGHDLAAVVMHRSAAASAPDPSSRSAPVADPTTASDTSLGSIVGT